MNQRTKEPLLSETSPAYRRGFKDGLEKGVEKNPYKTQLQYWHYRNGYDAGVSEYCRTHHPEDENNDANIPTITRLRAVCPDA